MLGSPKKPVPNGDIITKEQQKKIKKRADSAIKVGRGIKKKDIISINVLMMQVNLISILMYMYAPSSTSNFPRAPYLHLTALISM